MRFLCTKDALLVVLWFGSLCFLGVVFIMDRTFLTMASVLALIVILGLFVFSMILAYILKKKENLRKESYERNRIPQSD